MTRTHLPKSIAAAVAGAALASAIGLTTAFASDDDTVELTLDGATTSVPLEGETVGDVLEEEGLEVGEHDLLSPARDTVLSDGDRIALRRAKQLQLQVDGQTRTVWVLADDVAGALQQAGVGTAAFVSASRSRSLTDVTSLEVRTPKRIGILVDGTQATRLSTAATVAEHLREARVALKPGDKVTPAAATPLRMGLVIRVARQVTKVEAVRAGVTRQPDATLAVGKTTTVTAGTAGSVRRTYELRTLAPGKVQRVLLATTPVKAAVPAVVKVGTRPAPKKAAVSSGSTAIPRSGGLNWAALAQCESGGNPRTNTGNGYYGLYQFSLPTWRSVGGSGLPSDASAAEQTKRAQILYDRSGRGQWPTCGRRL